MIRLKKYPEPPKSLFRRYCRTRPDVYAQMIADQHGKCYLCERRGSTDFEADHLRSRSRFPWLAYEWRNLLLICTYCNRRKSSFNDDLLNPLHYNVEQLIEQRIDFTLERAMFRASKAAPSKSVKQTIALLDRLYNGAGNKRTVCEQRFYKDVERKVKRFHDLCDAWLREHQQELYDRICKELEITAEFLGFKYWIVKDNDELCHTFGHLLEWHGRRRSKRKRTGSKKEKHHRD